MTDLSASPERAGAASSLVAPDSATQLRALVVDDDASINRLLQIRLRNRGFTVSSASNGDLAIEMIRAERPDLVLLDVALPGTGGLEVLAWVRQQALDVAIIMTTAFGSEQVAIDALRRGADDYLRKPFEPAEFNAVLERTVSRLLLSRQNAELRRQLDEKRQQLERELARAAVVQQNLLPQTMPSLPGYSLHGACIPAFQVGGDFWDWQIGADGALRLTLGDVMGKGMSAALLMASARSAIRAASMAEEPGAAILAAEQALADDLARTDSFVTAVHARIEVETGRVQYVDAGHGLAAIRHRDGTIVPLAHRTSPLGLAALFALDLSSPFHPTVTISAGPSPDQHETRLEPGAALILFSDGLLDALPNDSPTMALLADRLRDADDAVAITKALVALAETDHDRSDDLTVVALHRSREASE